VAAGLAPEDEALRRAVVGAVPEVLSKEYNASFQQAQFFTNAPLFSQLLKASPGGTLERLVAISDPAERVREAFLAVYGRLPDADEVSRALLFQTAREGRQLESVRDLMWALLSSAEFLTMP